MSEILYNAQILADMVKKFSLEETVNFCKLNAYYWIVISEQEEEENEIFSEAVYESTWWENAGKELEERLKELT